MQYDAMNPNIYLAPFQWFTEVMCALHRIEWGEGVA